SSWSDPTQTLLFEPSSRRGNELYLYTRPEASCNSNRVHTPVITVTDADQPRHQPEPRHHNHAQPTTNTDRTQPRQRLTFGLNAFLQSKGFALTGARGSPTRCSATSQSNPSCSPGCGLHTWPMTQKEHRLR